LVKENFEKQTVTSNVVVELVAPLLHIREVTSFQTLYSFVIHQSFDVIWSELLRTLNLNAIKNRRVRIAQSVGIETRLRARRQRNRGSVPDRGKEFFFGGSPSLLYSEYQWLFPRGKVAGP
jgi:hypothetical protein